MWFFEHEACCFTNRALVLVKILNRRQHRRLFKAVALFEGFLQLDAIDQRQSQIHDDRSIGADLTDNPINPQARHLELVSDLLLGHPADESRTRRCALSEGLLLYLVTVVFFIRDLYGYVAFHLC